MIKATKKLFFLVNPSAGKNNIDWKQKIQEHFSAKNQDFEIFELPNPCDPALIRKKIASTAPDTVIAVGGDGTLKLAVEATRGMDIVIGLLPAGSANGMAKELGIPVDPEGALNLITEGTVRNIHLTKINESLCIHLSDIGFNAYVVKMFQEENRRGMWGYIKAAWKVLWSYSKMLVEIKMDDGYVRRKASMVVIANGTRYGTGVVINPEGTLDDDLFEVVIVRKISFSELFKMRFSHKPFHPKKTEIFQTSALKITTTHHVHFQVDGEYLGKLYSVYAKILPKAVKIIVPIQESKND